MKPVTVSRSGLFWLAVACVAAFILTFVPFARILTYPYVIFSTFIHETAHALAAVLTFGRVHSLIVHWNGSGVTQTSGGFTPLIVGSGYVGTAIFGGALILLSQKQQWVRPALIACALLVALSTIFFVGHANNAIVFAGLLAVVALLLVSFYRKKPRGAILLIGSIAAGLLFCYLLVRGSLFTWAIGTLIVAALSFVIRFASLPVAHFFLTFLAVQCSLNAIDSLRMLYSISSSGGCKASDATIMASLTGIPAVAWAIVWALIAIAFLGFALARSFRSSS